MRKTFRLTDARDLTGLDLKTLNTLIRREFLSFLDKDPIGPKRKKHEYIISFEQLLWLKIFRLCIQGFHFRYDQFAKSWMDDILKAIAKGENFLAIVRPVDKMDITLEPAGTYDVVMEVGRLGLVSLVINVQRMREDLIKNIEKMNGEK